MRKTIIAFLAALAVALTSSATASAASTYVVQPGDSLFFIAQRYNISLNTLQAANALHNTTIYPGQVLTIPGGSNSYYTVQPGDTLFIIAQKYGINYSQLQQANNLSTSQIYPGQRLVIPTASGGGTSSYTNYRVQNGDTLYLISQRYGVSIAQIQSLNGLSGTTIYPGQNLKSQHQVR